MENRFKIAIGTEESDPELAVAAWRLQANSYLELGFIQQEAIDSDGFIVPAVDHARGPNVRYFVAMDPSSHQVLAAVRKVLPPDGDVESLPASRVVAKCVDQPVREYLEASGAGRELVEVAGLASASGGDLMAVRALLRAFIHDGASRGESWLMTVVRPTFQFLRREYGATNFLEIGRPQFIRGPGVAEDVRLVPAISHACGFVRRLAVEASHDAGVTAARRLEALAYLMVGLDDNRANTLVGGLGPDHASSEAISA